MSGSSGSNSASRAATAPEGALPLLEQDEVPVADVEPTSRLPKSKAGPLPCRPQRSTEPRAENMALDGLARLSCGHAPTVAPRAVTEPTLRLPLGREIRRKARSAARSGQS